MSIPVCLDKISRSCSVLLVSSRMVCHVQGIRSAQVLSWRVSHIWRDVSWGNGKNTRERAEKCPKIVRQFYRLFLIYKNWSSHLISLLLTRIIDNLVFLSREYIYIYILYGHSRVALSFGIAWARGIGVSEHVTLKLAKTKDRYSTRSHLLSKRSPCAWEDIHLALDSLFLSLVEDKFYKSSSKKDLRSSFVTTTRIRAADSRSRDLQAEVHLPLSLRMRTLISLITIASKFCSKL